MALIILFNDKLVAYAISVLNTDYFDFLTIFEANN